MGSACASTQATVLLCLRTLRRVAQAISCKKMQEQAHCAVNDGLNHPALKRLKVFGRAGGHMGNVERDLHVACRRMHNVELREAEVSVKRVTRRGREIDCKAGVIYAHEIWAFISEMPERFAELMLPADKGPLSRFWNAVRSLLYVYSKHVSAVSGAR